MFRTGIFYILLLFFNCTADQENRDEITFSEKNKTAVPVFVYHRFGEEALPSTNISLEVFRKQLELLRDQGYNVIKFSDLFDIFQQDSTRDNLVSITIDDGYKSVLSGVSLLQKYNFPATIFINTESVGKSGYLNWDEIRELKKSGIEIGNHSHSHAHFIREDGSFDHEFFTKDLKVAQQEFLKHLDESPEIYAYPYGEFVPAMKEILKKNGLKMVAAQKSGVISSKADFFELPRFPMGGPFGTLEGFKTKIKMQPLLMDSVRTASMIINENPPLLEFKISGYDQYNIDAIHGFVGGEKIKLKSLGGGVYQMKANEPLKSRRTLYTITIPDHESQWHWFSHLWINPSISDE